MSEESQIEAGDWPLWRIVLREIRERSDYGYGMQIDVAWLEGRLNSKRDSSEFAFAFLCVKQEIEDEEGYYLGMQTIQDPETAIRHEVCQIPSASDHGLRVAQTFEAKQMRYCKRALQIRQKTLNNPSANLSDSERERIEGQTKTAAIRLVLLRRQKSVIKHLTKHSPKLLLE
jgi:hypothetical protein